MGDVEETKSRVVRICFLCPHEHFVFVGSKVPGDIVDGLSAWMDSINKARDANKPQPQIPTDLYNRIQEEDIIVTHGVCENCSTEKVSGTPDKKRLETKEILTALVNRIAERQMGCRLIRKKPNI